MTAPGDHPFALCLTHDVDRPFKRGVHGLFYALRGRPGYHLRTALPDRNPYWQFGEIAALERDRGVRSAFYFLDEPHLLERPAREWASPRRWVEQLGRYEVARPPVADVVRSLAGAGWEVGLHGSLASADDAARLAREKERLERVLGAPVLGGRQHRLRLEEPGTWRRQRGVGLRYDATLGSPTAYGFQHGYGPRRPFDDEFVVFPLTLMDQALPDPGDHPDRAWAVCESLLAEAAEHGAVMTVLWHPRLFSEADFPGHRDVYERLLDRALAMDAWVGPPGALYRTLVDDPPTGPAGAVPTGPGGDPAAPGVDSAPDVDRSAPGADSAPDVDRSASGADPAPDVDSAASAGGE